MEEDQEEETITGNGGVESGSVDLDESREVEGQGTVGLTGERIEFSSPNTIVSPRKRTHFGKIRLTPASQKEKGGSSQSVYVSPPFSFVSPIFP